MSQEREYYRELPNDYEYNEKVWRYVKIGHLAAAVCHLKACLKVPVDQIGYHHCCHPCVFGVVSRKRI